MLQWLTCFWYKILAIISYAYVNGNATFRPSNTISRKSFEELFVEETGDEMSKGMNGCPVRVREKKSPYKIYVIKKIVGVLCDVEKLQEVRRLAKLKHFNIVKYFDCWIEHPAKDNKVVHPVLYVQMAPYDKNLWQWSCQRKPSDIPTELIYEWMEQLAGAMKYCHEQSVTHTDLKLQNIFVYKDKLTGIESLVIGDFGIAYGTAAYMSPEQQEVHSNMNNLYNEKATPNDSEQTKIENEKEARAFYSDDRQKILDDNVTDVFTMGLIFAELLVSRVRKLTHYDRKNLFRTIRYNRGDDNKEDNETDTDKNFLDAASSILRNRHESVNKLDGQSEDVAFLNELIADLAMGDSVNKLDGQSEDDEFLKGMVADLAPCTSADSIEKNLKQLVEKAKQKPKRTFLEEYKDCITEAKLRELIYHMTHKEPQLRLRFAEVLDKIKYFRKEIQAEN